MPAREISDGNGSKIDLDSLSERELLIVTAKQFAEFRDEMRVKIKQYDELSQEYIPEFQKHLASHRTLYIVLITTVPVAAFLADILMRLFR